ncbi:hypothetical protein Golax_009223, partial [Gossypium laxum]|nr:hypothetical protein [Gossypium laxum]
MKSMMANLWHPVKGIQILDIGENDFSFRFFHKIDMDKVVKGSPRTFNNPLLMLHCLTKGEDSLKVPLINANFLVQIHEIPTGFFIESLARQLGNFLRKFLEYDGTNLGKGLQTYYFKYEQLTLLCFFCGRLGHNDSYCEAKMTLGFEVAEIRWDLSLRAQSRRALAMSSMWLREEGEGVTSDRDTEEQGGRRNWNDQLLRGKPTSHNKNLVLKRPWIVELTGSMNGTRRRSYGFLTGIEVAVEGSKGGLCLAWEDD